MPEVSQISRSLATKVAWLALLIVRPPLLAAQTTDDTLAGANTIEHRSEHQPHLLGNWSEERERLSDRGINFDLQYVSDSLWNIRSTKQERLAVWNRARGTVDLDFSKLTGTKGLALHITAVYQGGGNLGTYLGTLTGPSGLASTNAFRLDSWWLEKSIFNDHIIVRSGQFAGVDFYGTQLFGPSFIFEPLQYGFGNLSAATYESFDPPSTPAAELRVIPAAHFYVKSMVFAADRAPYTHNPTGLVPDFRGAAASASEIGYSPGRKASAVRAQDTITARKGYAGLYQLGAIYNPGRFNSISTTALVSGNYLIYGEVNQAVFRTSPYASRGLDVTANVDWTPPDRTRNYKEFTAGARFNEPLAIALHNTLGIAYVRNGINKAFPVASMLLTAHNAEHAFEANLLVEFPRTIILQPVVQYYRNTGGSSNNAVVFGFHSKIDF